MATQLSLSALLLRQTIRRMLAPVWAVKAWACEVVEP
jgi:hypothetical protein